MTKELPFYTKQSNGGDYPNLNVMEVTEDGYLEIHKTTSKKDKHYVVYRISNQRNKNLSLSEFWETSWMHKPEYSSTKEEFESLKFEFLNWVDQTFER